MPQKYKIKYAPAAVDDMDEVFSYISQDNIVAAEALLENIDNAIVKLADFTNIGSVLPEDEYTLINSGYRFIVVHPHLVFYKVLDKTITIHRILHGRRDYLRELFGS